MNTTHKFEIKNEDGVRILNREDGEVFFLQTIPILGGASIRVANDQDRPGVDFDPTVSNIMERGIKHADAFYRDEYGRGVWPSIN